MPGRPSWLTDELVAQVATDWLLAIDADARHCFVGRRVARLLGYEADELVGRPLDELVAPGRREELRVMWARVRSGESVQFTAQFVHREGDELWLELAAAPRVDDDGRILGAVMLINDITARRRAERERDESVARLRAAFDNVPFDFWITGVDGRYVWQNAKSLQHWGDRRGKTPLESGLPPAVAAEFEDNNRRAMRGEVVRTESEYESGGEQRVVDKIIAPVRVGGEIYGTLGVNIDITERRRLEQQLARTQRMEALGRLAGGIAHDFNNLITAILSSCHLLLHSDHLDPQQREDVELIRAVGTRAAELTRQLLSFARRQPTRPSVVHLDAQLRDVSRLLRRVLGEDIDLSVRVDDGTSPILVDPSQLEQVLINLATNARNALPRGGRLRIHAADTMLDRPLQAVTGLVPAGEYVCLSVADDGIGMDEDTLAHAFEPFFTSRPSEGGTGLGLPSCYGIIKQAGGFISVDSAPGQGTEFRIYLPRTAAAAAADGASPEPLPEGRESVLLVEDDSLMRGTIAQLLRKQGYRVIEADSGARALSVVRSCGETIDLVLSDIVMPDMRGPDMIEILAREGLARRFLLMSGYTETDPARALDSGADLHFLPKPFDPDTLARKVREVLDGG